MHGARQVRACTLMTVDRYGIPYGLRGCATSITNLFFHFTKLLEQGLVSKPLEGRVSVHLPR